MLNHTLVEGQVVGGLAQGLGQALLEQVVYDPAKRPARHRHVQRLRHAARRPRCRRSQRSTIPVLCRTNPLGVKGVGEAGTTGSLAAIMNAIADAIPDGCGADMQMPATPEKIWRACKGPTTLASSRGR